MWGQKLKRNPGCGVKHAQLIHTSYVGTTSQC